MIFPRSREPLPQGRFKTDGLIHAIWGESDNNPEVLALREIDQAFESGQIIMSLSPSEKLLKRNLLELVYKEPDRRDATAEPQCAQDGAEIWALLPLRH
jgi:hypothetical protein